MVSSTHFPSPRRAAAVFAIAALCLCLSLPCVMGDNTWDYMMLVARWPGTVCEFQSGCSIPSNVTSFNLHGMWPQRNDGSYPSNCDPSYPFSQSEIMNLEPLLSLYWTSFYGSSQWDFWAHEWVKHGTCALSSPLINSENSFFASAVDALRKMNILQNLARVGITPSTTTQYTSSQISDGLKKTFGYDVQVLCYSDKKSLQSIVGCVDKNLTFFDCPSTSANPCTGGISFPPIRY